MKDGFCHIVAYSSYVNLGFNRGALLPDPGKALAGTGKLIRHVTIQNHDDLERPLIRRFLQAAIQQVNESPAQPAPKTAPRNQAVIPNEAQSNDLPSKFQRAEANAKGAASCFRLLRIKCTEHRAFRPGCFAWRNAP